MIDFERRFVHCFWNNELEGKKGFVADTLADLRSYVEDKAIPYIVELSSSGNKNYQFTYYKDNEITSDYQFCYYDPLYEMKVAYEEGKIIQHFSKATDKWEDCECRPLWNDDFTEYRIKPEEQKFEIVILYGLGLRITQSTVSTEFRRVLFKGTEKECGEWLKNNNDIQIAINGYFLDKPIVYKEKGVKNDPWKEIKELPYDWDFDHYEYRIKPEEKKEDKYVPFENIQELIEAWEKKCPANKDRPDGTMPLIWVMSRNDNRSKHLITDFYNDGVGVGSIYFTLTKLFDECVFIDSTPCGKLK